MNQGIKISKKFITVCGETSTRKNEKGNHVMCGSMFVYSTRVQKVIIMQYDFFFIEF